MAWGPEGWSEHAACKGRPVDVFFRPGLEAHAVVFYCWRCPVRAHCLADAVTDASRAGVWGATTEAERAEIRAVIRNPGSWHPASRQARRTLGWLREALKCRSVPLCPHCGVRERMGADLCGRCLVEVQERAQRGRARDVG